LPREVPFTGFVESTGCSSADGHLVHFDRKSYIILGTRYAEAYSEVAAKAGDQTNPARSLFDGRSLDGWAELDYAGHGTVRVKDGGVLEIGMGDQLTGLRSTNEPVRMNYEITLEGRRTLGSDFFCGLTFPVLTNSCTLILGGWGGGLIGLSSLDGLDASENETTGFAQFEENRWYRIRLRVTPGRIEAWLDDRKFVNVETEGRRLGMRPGEIEISVPLGLATWQTRGELRDIRLRKLE
jgi:hypothetical protein